MHRMVIIFDQANESYDLFCGDAVADLEVKRRTTNSRLGYCLVLDKTVPYHQSIPLQIGPKSSLTLTIFCEPSKRGCKLKVDEYQWIEHLFDRGTQSLKDAIESIISHLKSRSLDPHRGSIYINQLTASVFPYLMDQIRNQAKSCLVNFPYLKIEITASSNLSSLIDKTQDAIDQAKLDAWTRVNDPKLYSAYPPDEEFEYRIELQNKSEGLFPQPSQINQDDIDRAIKIIDAECEQFQSGAYLQLPQSNPRLPAGKK